MSIFPNEDTSGAEDPTNQEFPLISVAGAFNWMDSFYSVFWSEEMDESTLFTRRQNAPSLQGNHKNLKIELVTEGLSSPTSMAFVDDNKILVLEKNTGLSSSYF